MAVELKDLTKADDNYSQWYNELVVKAGLAENSAVRGCMVIKPYGYAIWEKMQAALERFTEIKEKYENRKFEKQLHFLLWNAISNSILITQKALARKESIGSHYILK